MIWKARRTGLLQFLTILWLMIAMVTSSQLVAAERCRMDSIHDNHLELPDNQDRAEMTVSVGSYLRRANMASGLVRAGCREGDFLKSASMASFSGEGLIEVGVIISGPPYAFAQVTGDGEANHLGLFAVTVEGRVPRRNSQAVYSYREIVASPDRLNRQVDWFFRVHESGSSGPYSRDDVESELYLPILTEGDEAEVDELELTLVLQRIKNYCTMSATVSGDIDGHYFGDVAFFNRHAPGKGVAAGTAAGSMGDPEAWEAVEGFTSMEMCGPIIKLAEQYGTEIPPACLHGPEEDESFTDFIESDMAGDDNFGLSLVDMVIDDKAPEVNWQGLRALTGAGFTLNLSGALVDAEGYGEVIPSTLTVTAGAKTDLGAVKFELPSPGAANVKVFADPAIGGDFLYGGLEADLQTRGSYTIPGIASNRPLRIHVDAAFGALRGSMGCQR